MKYAIVRREMNGNESVVISKNTYQEIEKIWKEYVRYAEKMGWFVYFSEPVGLNIGDYIEDIDNGLIYSLEAY